MIVLFDEVARDLLKCSPESLLESDIEAQGFNLPQAITNLIGTSHTFEFKTSSYFEHGTFESFTLQECYPCTRRTYMFKHSAKRRQTCKPSYDKIVKKDFVQRPKFVYSNKICGGEKKKRMEYEDSDTELPHDDQGWSVDGSASEDKKRLRYVMTDSESKEEEVSPKAEPMKENEINDEASINDETTS